MTIFYKAVNPQGLDFYSETVDYTAHLGEWLPEKEHADNPECCSSDVYHVSTSAADTLVGGFWPCRLFEVEGEAVAEEDNKRGVYTMRVVREIEAWRALGPNGEAAVRLIKKARDLTADQVGLLYAARYAAWNAAWNAARDVAWYVAGDAAWNAARNAARYAAWNAARDAARYAAWNAAWDVAWDAAWNAARDAAGDVAGALVVRDLITEKQFNVLAGSWISVMGEI